MVTTVGHGVFSATFLRKICISKFAFTKGVTLLATLLSVIQVQAASSQGQFLADLSLEQLAALQVTSVSKTAKPVSNAPAAIFVITENDIRGAGVTSLPEALRLAPNLQVARLDAHGYAITSRGFNSAFANKLLVMIDGRTIYSPLFSGVFWDAQDVLLEDLDQIEVVSGPGGTLWGANAVNGVINIVTKSAAATQGELISLGGSSNEQQAAVRYGGRLNNGGHYRIYAKHSQHEDTYTANGISTETGWNRSQTGFRADWGDSEDSFTLQGDAYTGRLGQTDAGDIDISGANLMAKGSRTLSPTSKLSVQIYVDHTERDQPSLISDNLDTIDLELQHEWRAADQHRIVWGGGYRYSEDQIDNYDSFALLPIDLNMSWRNVFVQDEIELRDNLRLTLGTKFEDTAFTSWEPMPSAQLAWTPKADHLLWTSLSRAVRSPSRIDKDVFFPLNPPVIDGIPQYLLAGGPEFVSEVAKVFELGYRAQPVRNISFSITGYYNQYEKLRTLELNTHGSGLIFENKAKADTYGIETWGSWQATDAWRLRAGFVAQHMKVNLEPGSADLENASALASIDPDFYWQLRSSYAISEHVSFDSTLRHVDKLEESNVPAYTALDVRFAWSIGPRLTLSLVGQNLLDDRHAEFNRAPGRSEYERAFYGKLVWGL